MLNKMKRSRLLSLSKRCLAVKNGFEVTLWLQYHNFWKRGIKKMDRESKRKWQTQGSRSWVWIGKVNDAFAQVNGKFFRCRWLTIFCWNRQLYRIWMVPRTFRLHHSRCISEVCLWFSFSFYSQLTVCVLVLVSFCSLFRISRNCCTFHRSDCFLWVMDDSRVKEREGRWCVCVEFRKLVCETNGVSLGAEDYEYCGLQKRYSSKK